MSTATRIWLTRPHDDSEHMARELNARGIATLVAPVMHIVPCAITLTDTTPPAALMLTSRSGCLAMPSLPTAWRSVPVYCVGAATAEAAACHGFKQIVTGNGTALELLTPLITAHRAGERIVHLSGNEVRTDLAPLLAPYGMVLERLITYRAEIVDALEPSVIDALRQQQLHGLVLYSPRSARMVYDLLVAADCLSHLHRLDAYCLSLDVAAEAAALGCKRLHACPVPTHHAMMELLSATAITSA